MEKFERSLDLARIGTVREPVDGAEVELLRIESKAAVRPLGWKRLRAPILLDEAAQRRLRLCGGTGRDAASEAYRVVRTHLLQRMARKGFRTLAIVSAAPDDGKTLSAVNLAFSIAQDTRYTALLVDLDLRGPSVHTTLELDVAQGLERYFDGSVDLGSLLVTVMNERMAVLPCLHPVDSPSEVLASAGTQALVGELASRYRDRIVLFDLSPMLVGDDVISFLPYVDAALVVVGEGVTRKGDLKRVFELIGETPVVGTILNRSREATLKTYR